MVRTFKSLLNLPENLIFSNENTHEFKLDIRNSAGICSLCTIYKVQPISVKDDET